MPDIYGKPEPRAGEDNGKPRLSINELIRLNMVDLRELAANYNITHEDMMALKKQEIVFSILKAHTERGGIKIKICRYKKNLLIPNFSNKIILLYHQRE